MALAVIERERESMNAPAICLMWEGSRVCRPPLLGLKVRSAWKMMRRTFRFTPIPIASLATRICTKQQSALEELDSSSYNHNHSHCTVS